MVSEVMVSCDYIPLITGFNLKKICALCLGKTDLGIEEYNFSQSTLEQVSNIRSQN